MSWPLLRSGSRPPQRLLTAARFASCSLLAPRIGRSATEPGRLAQTSLRERDDPPLGLPDERTRRPDREGRVAETVITRSPTPQSHHPKDGSGTAVAMRLQTLTRHYDFLTFIGERL